MSPALPCSGRASPLSKAAPMGCWRCRALSRKVDGAAARPFFRRRLPGINQNGAQSAGPHIHVCSVAPSFSLLAIYRQAGTRMDALLLIVAWGAGLISLFLVADMIASDIVNRRAERVAARIERERRPARRR